MALAARIPGYDGSSCGDFPAIDPAVFPVPEKDHGRRVTGRYQRMMEFMKRLQHLEASGARSGSDASVNHRRHLHKHRSAMCLSMCLAAAGTSLVLSGCHGARQQAETFSVSGNI